MKREELKRIVSKWLCKEKTDGVICDCFNDETSYGKVLMIEYRVSDRCLTMYEKLMCKRVETGEHLGMLPRRVELEPAIPNCKVGDRVTVMYSKNNNARAYILENEGFIYSFC